MVEDALAVEVPRGVDGSEGDAGPAAGGEGAEHGGEVGGRERGENVARGGTVGGVRQEGEERAPRREGEGGRQVPGLPTAAAAASRVVGASEPRGAGGGGGGGAGGG